MSLSLTHTRVVFVNTMLCQLTNASYPSSQCLDFIRIFYPDDLDLDFTHQSLDFAYSA